ncbi:MAG: GNAT family N-acetyltransferase [Burkholderiales bacterium]|nr:GNAT family N-acetyltransferase [Burkholderiales bacterium]
MKITTDRLLIRELTLNDTEFIFELLNQSSWKKYIGNKNIKSIEDAKQYLIDNTIKMYETHGFGLWCVTKIYSKQPLGIAGVTKRDNLPVIDIGFAFLDRFIGHGYAYEACEAILDYTKSQLNSEQILAIVKPENNKSIKLLDKLGFTFKEQVHLNPADNPLNLMEKQLVT